MVFCIRETIRAAEEGGFSYSIVRPGQIKGDPFLTYSRAGGASLSPDAPEKGSAKRMVSLRQGDTEAGDVNPSSVAEAFTQVSGWVQGVPCMHPPARAFGCDTYCFSGSSFGVKGEQNRLFSGE